MADLFDYLDWRGDIGFEAVGVTPVDGLIFSALAYVHYDGLVREDFTHPVPLEVVADAFAVLPDKAERVLLKNDGRLLQAAAGTERYRHVELVFYRSETVPELESQFAAVAFLLPNGQAVLAFRGTDATLVGWKEDFNMSFQPCVPAQEKALYYTQTFAGHHDHPLILCGHSKGGNLAVYAASRCPEALQSRILAVYNNDGPGFTESLMGDPGYRAMVPKIHSYVPESSVVGLLLEHEEPCMIIKSRQVSILQHDEYSWEVLGGDFVRVEDISGDSRFINGTLHQWLAGKTRQERNAFVDAMFELLGTGEVSDARHIILPWNILNYIRTLTEDEQMRRTLTSALADLFRAANSLRKRELPEK
ncbi:MAG: DUF2974 domain-containing protein [Oscillospiraceae bacterium]|nr:DUF2974 domain-containing protein [Oscillospiraceae bacterium]